jgi:hypothetical protein
MTEFADFIAISEEALLLRQAYLDAGVLTGSFFLPLFFMLS